jgi:hypothetical protein
MHPWQMDTLAELNNQHHQELLHEAAAARELHEAEAATMLANATTDEQSGRPAQRLLDALLALPARLRMA